MPRMRTEFEFIELKKGKNKKEGDELIITRQEVLDLKNGGIDINELETKLVKKLRQQVDQIKTLKEQAKQTRGLILRIRANRQMSVSEPKVQVQDKKAGPIDPAPEQLPAQR